MSASVLASCFSGHTISPTTKANVHHRQDILASGRILSRAAQRRTATMLQAQSSAGNEAEQRAVWALDFDGVVCNSVGESSQTAWKAAEQHWPYVFKSEQASAKRKQVLRDMELVRPVVETGYENLIQVRCLLEGISTEKILTDWHRLLPEYMNKWNQSRKEAPAVLLLAQHGNIKRSAALHVILPMRLSANQYQLVELFGSVRDAWIAEDLHSWLDANGIYPGLPQDLSAAQKGHELYIVTTKQARFTEALMKDKAKIDFSADRIFSTAETGQPKSEVLKQLEQRHPGTRYHFVEDKIGTLEKVCQVKELDHWMLYLVDWGYNTKQEREQAANNPRIQVVNHQQLSQAIAG